MARRISVYEQYGSKPLSDLTPERIEFMQRCLALRIEGYDYNRMAAALGCEYTTCRKAVKEALAQSVTEMADEVRAIEMQRLDELLMAHWPERGEPRHADVIMKLMDRRSKYLGLDVPQTDLMDAAQALREFIAGAARNTGADIGMASPSEDNE
jgi:hypothetical protein